MSERCQHRRPVLRDSIEDIKKRLRFTALYTSKERPAFHTSAICRDCGASMRICIEGKRHNEPDTGDWELEEPGGSSLRSRGEA